MKVISVSQLNRYVKSLLEGDANLAAVYIGGEISNFTNHYKSGHLYMSLKDEGALVKAVMFRAYASKLAFTPENGMKVIVRARVSLYEKDGAFQIYIEEMQPDGVGALQIAFEQLKKKLAAEGLFEASRKKPLPRYPARVGVITSPTGAAVRDIRAGGVHPGARAGRGGAGAAGRRPAPLQRDGCGGCAHHRPRRRFH